jgi:hypothetical protein
MTKPSKPAMINLIAAATRSVLILGVSLVAFGAASPAFAQASVTLQQNVTVYRAFYYDASDSLLHVEVVHNADGRFLQPLLSAPPKAAPRVPPQEPGAAVLIGDKARYAVYYGLDSSQAKPRPGQADVQLKPLAIEKLSDADASRPIECASPGGDTCVFPRMCHCGAVGGCCCF